MASSSSSSSYSYKSWSPPTEALWVCQTPALDHNEAFKKTQENFNARLEALRASGLSVVSEIFELFDKVKEYIEQNRPDGIDLLGFRMHANAQSLPLSDQSGGTYSLAHAGTAMAASVQNIFSKVSRFVMIEGCQTGSGKKGILKHVVSLCSAGVVGIGSKGSQFEVSFDPTLPGYMSFHCLKSKKEITRIYYKAENGSVQNIPADELMLLWDVFKEKCSTSEEKQRGFELCYQLLGKRNDPGAFAKILAKNQELIEPLTQDSEAIIHSFVLKRAQEKKGKGDIKHIWKQMLSDLEKMVGEVKYTANGWTRSGYRPDPKNCVPYPGENALHLAAKQTDGKSFEDEKGTIPAIRRASHPYAKAYLFLLGCGLIDQHKTLFMLLDNQQSGNNPATRAIFALSDIAIHGSDKEPVYALLASDLQIIKRSYQIAKELELLKEWYFMFAEGVCFNEIIEKVRTFFYERQSIDKEIQLMHAVRESNFDAFFLLLNRGADIHFCDPKGACLFEIALKTRNLKMLSDVGKAMQTSLEQIDSHQPDDLSYRRAALKCWSALFADQPEKAANHHEEILAKGLGMIARIHDEQTQGEALDEMRRVWESYDTLDSLVEAAKNITDEEHRILILLGLAKDAAYISKHFSNVKEVIALVPECQNKYRLLQRLYQEQIREVIDDSILNLVEIINQMSDSARVSKLLNEMLDLLKDRHKYHKIFEVVMMHPSLQIEEERVELLLGAMFYFLEKGGWHFALKSVQRMELVKPADMDMNVYLSTLSHLVNPPRDKLCFHALVCLALESFNEAVVIFNDVEMTWVRRGVLDYFILPMWIKRNQVSEFVDLLGHDLSHRNLCLHAIVRGLIRNERFKEAQEGLALMTEGDKQNEVIEHLCCTYIKSKNDEGLRDLVAFIHHMSNRTQASTWLNQIFSYLSDIYQYDFSLNPSNRHKLKLVLIPYAAELNEANRSLLYRGVAHKYMYDGQGTEALKIVEMMQLVKPADLPIEKFLERFTSKTRYDQTHYDDAFKLLISFSLGEVNQVVAIVQRMSDSMRTGVIVNGLMDLCVARGEFTAALDLMPYVDREGLIKLLGAFSALGQYKQAGKVIKLRLDELLKRNHVSVLISSDEFAKFVTCLIEVKGFQGAINRLTVLLGDCLLETRAKTMLLKKAVHIGSVQKRFIEVMEFVMQLPPKEKQEISLGLMGELAQAGEFEHAMAVAGTEKRLITEAMYARIISANCHPNTFFCYTVLCVKQKKFEWAEQLLERVPESGEKDLVKNWMASVQATSSGDH